MQGYPCSAGMSKCRDVQCSSADAVLCVGVGWGGGGGREREREREMSSIRMYYLEVSCEYVGKS